MALPNQVQLANALLDLFRTEARELSVNQQKSLIRKHLCISEKDAMTIHSGTRTKLEYRLAWTRTQLKQLGALKNTQPGVWQITPEGAKLRLTESDFRELRRSSAAPETAGTGVELEDVETHIVKPFDPTLIRVESRPATLGQLITRMEHGEIDLAPAFQRKAGIWRDSAQSRLIESILVRIPIPAFYFDASNEDKWVVVDGLQRLTALKRFVIDKALTLDGLEFLDTIEGLTFDQIPRSFQRRINETGITVFLIEKNTPSNVKFNIFKRINTGGLPLSTQEIRHALNQGRVTTLLNDLSKCEHFKRATDYGIRDDRMADKECILRFLAFSIHSPFEYKSTDFDGFLSDVMAEINNFREIRLEALAENFRRSMTLAHKLFGGDAFRKPPVEDRRMPINKALFEAWSVNLGKLSNPEAATLINSRTKLQEYFISLCEEDEFFDAISQGTGDPVKVRCRFQGIRNIINQLIS